MDLPCGTSHLHTASHMHTVCKWTSGTVFEKPLRYGSAIKGKHYKAVIFFHVVIFFAMLKRSLDVANTSACQTQQLSFVHYAVLQHGLYSLPLTQVHQCQNEEHFWWRNANRQIKDCSRNFTFA